ncbi:MAG: choice-of-anchor D domain-containing protein [Ignavibacteriae bacterium]|nr:choice-of-anchor D domain-containing protein [Ignavibacteriota bacterium]
MIFRRIIILLLGVVTVGASQTLKSNLWITNGEVRSIVRNNHAIYLGGNFSQVGPSTGAGVVLNTIGFGQYDPTWPKVNGEIRAVISDGAGGWYIGGDFTNVGGVARNRLARILSNKTLSPWNPNANGSVTALAVHGAHVYVGGDFTIIGGQPRSRIAAIRVADGIANSWNPGSNGTVLTVAPSLNLVYVGGSFTLIGGQTRNGLAAFDTSSATPTAFDANVNGSVHTIALGINSLYLGGSFTAVGGRTRDNLASVSYAGTVQGYDPGPNGVVRSMRLVANSILYVGGEFTSISGVIRNHLAAIGAFTPTALTWNPNVDGAVYTLLINNLDVYVGGEFSSVGGSTRRNLARLDTLGAVSSWNPNAGSAVNTLALTGTTVYAGGSFATINAVPRNNLAVLDDSIGSVGAWDPNVTGGVINAMTISGSTLYVGGSFTTVGTQQRAGLAAVNAATGLATAWNPAPNDDVHAVSIAAGRVYVGGTFTSVGGSARNRIAAIDSATGAAIVTWNPNANGDVYALAIKGSALYAGGTFTTIGSFVRNKLAALNISTGVPTTWNPNGGTSLLDTVKAFALSGGVVYAGGKLSQIGGQARIAVAAIDSTTGNATSFDAGLQSSAVVNALRYAGGKLYVGGSISTGTTSDLISVNPVTGVSKTWDPKILGPVHAVVVTDTTVFTGGLFESAAGDYRPSFAGVVDPSLNIPILTANPPTLSFANVLVGQTTTDSILISNTGGGTLVISSASSNNSRFTVQPTSASIPEGSSRRFYVTFSPAGIGLQNATITFVHNAPNSPTGIITNGTGIAPLFSVVPATIDFHNVAVNSTKTDSVTVTNSGTAPLNISNVSSTNARFTVLPTNVQILPSSTQVFTITFAPNTIGAASGNILFTHDALGSPDTVSVSGTGTAPGFSVVPDSLNFGVVRVNTSKRDSLVVTNIGTSVLNISSVTPTNARFIVAPTNAVIPPLGSQKFYVTFSPDNSESYVAQLVFAHDAGGTSVVPLTGDGAVPVFSVNPSSLTFGGVLVGVMKTDTLSVKNMGTWPLTIDSAVSTNSRFTITPRSVVVDVDQTQKFIVTFKPLATGNVGANIIFTHDAVGSPHDVVVAGTGIAASISIAPDSLNFGSVVVNTSKPDSFTVINPGSADLIVGSVASTNTSFAVFPTSATVPPLGSVGFYVWFQPTVTGTQAGNIVLTHTAAGSPDTVRVRGTGVVANFLVTPSSLDFGNVSVGATARDSVTVTNNGGALLNIDTVISLHPRFSITPTRAQITPAGSRRFYITFTPTNAGGVNGLISFVHDAIGSPTNVGVEGNGTAAAFSAHPPSLNFGPVRVGRTRLDSVEVTNVGNAPLIISEVLPSNSRFAVAPTTAIIAPSASRWFAISFSPDSTGTSNAEVLFIHNGVGSPSAFPVSGIGVVPLFSLGATFKTFGNVVVNSTSTDSVSVTNRGGADLTISSVRSSNAEFTVAPQSAVIAPSGNSWFRISFRPTSIGLRSAAVIFEHDAANLRDTLAVAGTGIASTFSLSRSNIPFGNVKVGASRVDSVLVTNTGTSGLEVLSVATGDSRFSVAPTSAGILAGETQTFRVTFTPTARGAFGTSLTFIHTSAGSPTSISLSGTGLAPAFVLSRQNVAFGAVRVGFTKSDTITLANSGNDTLIVRQAASSDQRFAAVVADSILLPSESQTVLVRFTPDSLSFYEAYFAFTHNAEGSPTSIAVSGTGSAPVLLASPRIIDFGDVNLGDSSSATIRLVNVGTTRLTVDSLRIRGRNAGEFFVAGSGGPYLPVAPLETLKVALRFMPTSVDTAKSANLFAYSDAIVRVDSLLLRGRSRSSQVVVTLSGDTTTGSVLRIGATPPIGFTPSRALLFYRVAGRRVYDSLALSLNGSAYETAFPDSVMTIRGLEYYIVFSDAQRRVTNPPNDPVNNPSIVQVRTLSAMTAVSFASRQYKMISIPLELANTTIQSQLFDDYEPYNPSRWRVFRWEEDRNVEFDSIAGRFTPGTAFWLVTQSGSGFDADNGRSVRSVQPFTIALHPGWNQIASPFAFPVAWDSIPNSGLLRKPYAWDGVQYVPNVQKLMPWEGYFVFNDSNEAIQLAVPSVEAPSQLHKDPAPSITTNSGEFSVRFAAVNGALRDEYNYVGFASSAKIGKDLLDLPEPPQIQDFVQVSFVEDNQQYLANFKPISTEGHVWTLIVRSSAANQEISIGVEKIGRLPEGFDLFVLDEDEYSYVVLDRESFGVRVGASYSSRTFRVIVGTKEFAERSSGGIPLVPVEFSLGQNYPNPFNPTTTIRYTLGKRSTAVLEVFDVLGRLVKTLVHGEQLTGSHTIEFDGTTNSGGSMASGVYIYRLRAGEFVQSKKLLLLR